MFLVDLLRPRVVVELGTQYGDSYCAFCHSVHELNLTTRCYAIDNWQGDPHVSSYGPEVLADLRAHHDLLYGGFSRLIQSTFDDALQHFADGNIDLLHIDAYHIYEAVKHDFESWLPKMSQHGVVLFHDTNVRERDFGVWKFWEELQQQYPHFEFLHASGLGVLAVGKDLPKAFQEFLDASLEDGANIRRLFSQLGQRLTLEVQQRKHQQGLVEKEHQLTQLAAERERLTQEATQLQERQLTERAAERERLTQEATQLKLTIQGQQDRMFQLRQEVARLKETLEGQGRTLVKKAEEVRRLLAQNDGFREKEQKIASMELQIAELQGSVQSKDQEISQVIQERDLLLEEIISLEDNLAWMLLARYRLVRDKLFPDGTHRHRAYNAAKDSFKSWLREGKKVTGPWNHSRSAPQIQSDQISPQSPPETTAQDRYFADLFARSVSPSIEYVPIMKEDVDVTDCSIKLIAFYLPQFHPIPENDEWWGKGFTEWTQVSKAVPQFAGHYQPHLPGELGFYDLRLVDVQRRQIELAKKYGIYGFCFHYYWFNGKRLLERPLDQFLKNPDLDFPFCLCWANENWTRRWDGAENELLIAQTHSPEDDLAFMKSLEQAFHDKRYIKVHDRPLVVVYRPGILPDPQGTVARWRDYCVQAGIGNPYLLGAQTFDTTDPRPFGLDAAVEFPPHKLLQGAILLNSTLDIVNPQYQGWVADYASMIEAAKKEVAPGYTLYRGVCPSWDDEPRKPGRGYTFANASPDLYKEWLSYACAFADKNSDPEKKIVFINAWNEWGEGAHLEPDRKFGYAYLQATADVVRRFPKGKEPKEPDVSVCDDVLTRVQSAARLGNTDLHHRVFSSVTDAEWLWFNTEGYRRFETLRKVLPGLPDEEIQTAFVGAAGDAALGEGFIAYRLWKDLAAKFGRPLNAGSHVLDFGCGWGRVFRFFMRDVPRANLYGLDCMPFAIDLCEKTNPWGQFRLISPLPPCDLPSNTFDLVYLYSVFSHLSEQAEDLWLTEFNRIMRPGGVLIATTWPRDYIERCERARHGDPTGTHPHSYLAFAGAEDWLARYDRGEYCHDSVGGGEALSKTFYGETCIPEAYARQRWPNRFLLREYISDKARCPQDVIVAQKPN